MSISLLLKKVMCKRQSLGYFIWLKPYQPFLGADNKNILLNRGESWLFSSIIPLNSLAMEVSNVRKHSEDLSREAPFGDGHGAMDDQERTALKSALSYGSK